ncbi:MAG: hypothetical protein IJ180_00525 [Bacteroidales bacterium]|nr:hypothetical protein [Bacteroidales bacterium]
MEAIGILKYGRMQCKGDVIKWTDKKTKEVITFVRRPYAKVTPAEFQQETIACIRRLYESNSSFTNNSTKAKKQRIRRSLKQNLHSIPSIIIYKQILDVLEKYGYGKGEVTEEQELWIGKQWLNFFKQKNIKLY